MIPKKIHYCWLSGEPFPKNIQRYMQTWQDKLPDYEFVLWDTQRFDINSLVWCRQAFDAKKYAFAADYIRLYAIYTEGGIYLDCDIEVLKSFNDAIETDIMMAYEQTHDCTIEAGCFGAKKNHPFIKACLSYYQGRNFIKSDGSYDMKNLPVIMSEIMQKNFRNNEFIKFEPAVFTSKSALDGKIRVTKNTYAIHHFTSHYLNEEERLHRLKMWSLSQKIGNNIVSRLLIKGENLGFHLQQKGIQKTYQMYTSNLKEKFKL